MQHRPIKFSEREIQDFQTYYTGFASEKEKEVLDRILQKKYQISEWDEQFILACLRRLKVRLAAQSINTDSRIKNISKTAQMSRKGKWSQVLYKTSKRKVKQKKTDNFVYDSKGKKIYI